MTTSSMQIHLRSIKLYAYHGINAGEEILGGAFEVNVTVTFLPPSLSIDKIEQTLDYSVIYQIVKARMNKPSALLETVVHSTRCAM